MRTWLLVEARPMPFILFFFFPFLYILDFLLSFSFPFSLSVFGKHLALVSFLYGVST
jgi:hypothetical protein